MSFIRFLFFSFCFILFYTANGCSSGQPDGMPTVYPFYVTVKNGSDLISGAQVVLEPNSSISNVMISGMTDDKGKAEIATMLGNYMKKGAPEGSFTVIVLKANPVVHTKTPEERAAMDYGEQVKYEQKIQEEARKRPKLVPEKLSDPTRSPVKIDIGRNGGNLEIDLSDI